MIKESSATLPPSGKTSKRNAEIPIKTPPTNCPSTGGKLMREQISPPN